MPIEQILQGMCHMMHVDREQEAVSCLMMSGTFERMNQLIGFENALCAFYEYPDEVHEFFEAMCEYKLKCIDLTYKYLKPDIIHMHDDWGTNDNMFFSPEIWREFIKPIEKRLADRIHEYGMIYMHHSCGYITPIVGDLVEIGVDSWHSVQPVNDLKGLKEAYGERIVFAGAVDPQVTDRPGATEEEIRAEVRRVIDTLGKGGGLMASSAVMFSTVQGVDAIIDDEGKKYGQYDSLKFI
jgi:uroporphyrinogen decarboxylase